jgi:hypothetical protein
MGHTLQVGASGSCRIILRANALSKSVQSQAAEIPGAAPRSVTPNIAPQCMNGTEQSRRTSHLPPYFARTTMRAVMYG